MKKQFWVWDDPRFFTDTHSFNAPGPALHNGLKGIWIASPVDNQWEAERLYKENHNSERANKEWSFLDKVYPMYCKLFPKSWMK